MKHRLFSPLKAIRGRIINHYQLIALVQSSRCDVQRVDRCAEQTFFVVGGDDERIMTIRRSIPDATH